ncbi:Riboflavin biosynthesis protein RibD [Syntrophomonas zehnderi OL-4]|uniref:Riboflavin biosynthesis protein RibD n=1 Tax=Syntrophomonas zehnderi OL-4 TaxID=690567 RepID=A0A0E3W3F1_9FIRM|nr:bifunctional diaminohydroxyphosphoribosylaminopyrimidine deaminase/5-amino-6-(5-phosphoribosylamino)uracil reductase RibD [Syntrophomonas zehnderi]CFX77629.1 Riboflavin biosynthesis protein RibD [Syntrophomonas zehnderi OL-4]
MSASDQHYMQIALELASQALGRTSPNPVVGAVIVKDGEVVGAGYHLKAGTPHAEIHALNQAGVKASGATVYVTLEPCSHYGRTPPCADALVKAGVRRVVIATLDPNPQVAGQGRQKLLKAGIIVDTGIMEKEARQLNEAYIKYIQTRIPFVALKTAMTLDGKIAAAGGDSKWITAEDARNHVHRLRNIHDAILVGIGTVLHDDPRLNTRLNCDDIHHPVRVIIDSYLDLPLNSQIVKSSHELRSLVFCSSQADLQRATRLQAAGCEIIRLPEQEGLVPLENVLQHLGREGICSVLVEGGGEINASLLERQLVDKVYWFIAPKIIGGRNAATPVMGTGLNMMQEAWELQSIEVTRFEKDILITGYFDK